MTAPRRASPMATVCAFVLTRNRKILLAECLEALLAQTHPVDQVIVFDNASDDGTEALLRQLGLLDRPELVFRRSERNLGGAGGYAEGVRLGSQSGQEWLWLMDDDAEPHQDALERMLASPPGRDAATSVLCTAVRQVDGRVEPLHRCRLGRFIVPLPEGAYRPGTYADVSCASFVGFMIRTAVAREIGLPRAEFFLGYDDAEYSLRARRHGPIRLVPESTVVHKIAMGGGESTRRSRLWNRVLGQHYTSAPWESFWKNLYGVRNFMAVKHSRGPVPTVAFAGLTAVYVIKTLLYDAAPLRRLPWIVRYARKGRAGDFTGPSPDDWVRMTRRVG